MAKKITVVTKDKGGFDVTYPVVEKLKREFEIQIIAEGISIQLWINAGYKLRLEVDDLGDLVIGTYGSPIHLENIVCVKANVQGIPVLRIEDFWGVHYCGNDIPDAICTLDSAGESLIRQKTYLDKADVHITGSPAFDRLKRFANCDNHNFRKRLSLPSDDKIVFFAGPGFTDDSLEIISALDKVLSEQVDFVLIPRLHPKLKGLNPDGYSKCETFIAGWGDKVLLRPDDNMDDLIFCSDITISTYSLALVVAAYLRRISISYETQTMKQNFLQETGILTRFPLVDIGCSFEISDVNGLSNIIKLNNNILIGAQKRELRLDGKNAERVANVVKQMLS